MDRWTGRMVERTRTWARDSYGRPSRADYYSLKIVQTLLAANGGGVHSLEELVVRWGGKGEDGPTEEEEVERRKAAAGAYAEGTTHRRISRAEAEANNPFARLPGFKGKKR